VFNCTYPSLGNPYVLDMSEPYKAAVLEELLVRVLCNCFTVVCPCKRIDTALYTLLCFTAVVVRHVCSPYIQRSSKLSVYLRVARRYYHIVYRLSVANVAC
jgi:hypothetical protein